MDDWRAFFIRARWGRRIYVRQIADSCLKMECSEVRIIYKTLDLAGRHYRAWSMANLNEPN